MIHRPLLLALFCLLICRSDLRAGDTDPEQEKQKTIALLANLFQRAVPSASVEAVPGEGDSIILRGYVEQAEDIETILHIARAVCGPVSGAIVNAMVIGERPQVQVDVVMVRVDAAGLQSANAKRDRRYAERLWKLVTANMKLGVLDETEGKECRALLQSLRDAKHAEFLAEPKLATLSGRPATFFSGGEAKVPCVSVLGFESGVCVVPIGTQMSFLPIVQPDQKIHLELDLEVSALDPDSGVEINGVAIPGRQARRLRTTLTLEDGQTAVLGGTDDVVILATVHVQKAGGILPALFLTPDP